MPGRQRPRSASAPRVRASASAASAAACQPVVQAPCSGSARQARARCRGARDLRRRMQALADGPSSSPASASPRVGACWRRECMPPRPLTGLAHEPSTAASRASTAPLARAGTFSSVSLRALQSAQRRAATHRPPPAVRPAPKRVKSSPHTQAGALCTACAHVTTPGPSGSREGKLGAHVGQQDAEKTALRR